MRILHSGLVSLGLKPSLRGVYIPYGYLTLRYNRRESGLGLRSILPSILLRSCISKLSQQRN